MNDDIRQHSIELAESHVKFLLEWTEYVFVEAFVHGYKHACTDMKGERSKNDYYYHYQPTDITKNPSGAGEQMHKSKTSSPNYP